MRQPRIPTGPTTPQMGFAEIVTREKGSAIPAIESRQAMATIAIARGSS